jgi:DNA-directed RNA polymerase subunit E'/Rpb7
MERKNTQVIKKKKEIRLQTIYSRCLLSRKIVIPIKYIGKNLNAVIEEYINNNYGGKCVVEGFVKKDSVKIISFSSGTIERGDNINYEVIFECDVCFPVEGMLIACVAKNITKAGIRAESANEVPSPVIVYLAKDHHLNSQQFADIKEGDKINVRVIGQRFELNDKYVSIIGEIVKEKEYVVKPKQPTKPRLVFEE